jgi:hypothetical protein
MAAALALGSGACVTSSPSAPRGSFADGEMATLRVQKCGSCHAPPEPKAHTRAELEGVMLRHKNRVRLTPNQWERLIDYLAESPRNGRDVSALTQSLPFR